MGRLLAISVGSPHDFISSGRRARDIAMGSHLLADLTRHVAWQLKHGLSAQLVVPVISDEESALDLPARNSNKILAFLPHAADEADVEKFAKDALKARWHAWVSRTFKEVSSIVDPSIWERQTRECDIDLYLGSSECSAQMFAAEGEGVILARLQVELALAAKKTQRQFIPNPSPEAVPKSSLDGVRESCLIRDTGGERTRQLRVDALEQRPKLAYRLRLRAAEELDALGLIKRAASGMVLPSVTRTAIEPWVRRVRQDGDGTRLLQQIEALSDQGTGASPSGAIASGTGGQQGLENFAYDGAVMLRDRISAMLRSSRDEQEIGLKVDLLEGMKRPVAELHRLFGAPEPYYAVLSLDGDGIGKMFAACTSFEEQTRTSRRLQAYVDAVVREQIQPVGGTVLYAGGEDLVALLPVDQVFAVMSSVADAFAATLPGHTVSAGIAIAHCLDAFDGALAAARSAETEAKRYRRNGVKGFDRGQGCVCVHWIPRSGAEFRLAATHQRFAVWMDALVAMHRDGLVADAVGYQLQRIAARYDGSEAASHEMAQLQQAAKRGVPLELAQLLDRRKAGPAQIATLWEIFERFAMEIGDLRVALLMLGQLFVLARRIHSATPVRREAEEFA